jgi:hypothetical protein
MKNKKDNLVKAIKKVARETTKNLDLRSRVEPLNPHKDAKKARRKWRNKGEY